MKKTNLLFIAFLLSSAMTFAQNVGIKADGTAPDNSAMLDVSSSTKGLLIPRMTLAQIGAFVSPADGLMAYNTDDGKYYLYCATETVWKEINYGTGILHKNCGIITDPRDGKTYNTIVIGTQCWMAQNLNVGTRINGTEAQANNNNLEKYCYSDNDANCTTYGGLYQWDEMMQYTTTPGVQGICPTGWHLPTDDEWTTLTTYVSSQTAYLCNSNSAYIAKSLAANTNWNTSATTCATGNNLTVNNATGFTALPGGIYSGGSFNYLGSYGYWWSSTENSSDAWSRGMNYSNGEVYRNYLDQTFGFSVRCVRD